MEEATFRSGAKIGILENGWKKKIVWSQDAAIWIVSVLLKISQLNAGSARR